MDWLIQLMEEIEDQRGVDKAGMSLGLNNPEIAGSNPAPAIP